MGLLADLGQFDCGLDQGAGLLTRVVCHPDCGLFALEHQFDPPSISRRISRWRSFDPFRGYRFAGDFPMGFFRLHGWLDDSLGVDLTELGYRRKSVFHLVIACDVVFVFYGAIAVSS